MGTRRNNRGFIVRTPPYSTLKVTQRQDAIGVIDTLEISTKDKVQLSTLSDHTSESLIIGVTEHVSGHWAHVITFLVALDDVGTFTCIVYIHIGQCNIYQTL